MSDDFKDSVSMNDSLIIEKSQERPIGEIIFEYAKLRDFLKDERRKFKELESSLKADMEVLETTILDKQRELGVQSLSTDTYTAFQTQKTFVRMGDWDTFSKWILETGNVQCLEKRAAKLACLEVEEEGTDLHDIGIEKSTEIAVQIRKK